MSTSGDFTKHWVKDKDFYPIQEKKRCFLGGFPIPIFSIFLRGFPRVFQGFPGGSHFIWLNRSSLTWKISGTRGHVGIPLRSWSNSSTFVYYVYIYICMYIYIYIHIMWFPLNIPTILSPLSLLDSLISSNFILCGFGRARHTVLCLAFMATEWGP